MCKPWTVTLSICCVICGFLAYIPQIKLIYNENE
ncbi:PQ-loop domain-containing transporter [Okeanomitos corallinicola]